MIAAPELAVVMSVYNGGDALGPTIESVCQQDGVDFEFIIVNDGSCDRSGEVLDAYAARYSRIRVISQENVGLTRALIRGCAETTAPVIARQDVGDRSLPGRLRVELDLLMSDERNVLASCGTRFVSPEGDHLYEVTQTSDRADHGLRADSVDRYCGPSCHPAVMFRRAAYVEAGGYRPQLLIAQDMDLWLRLSALGRVVANPTVYYEAEIGLTGISAGRTHSHREIGAAILRGAALRARGESEAENLVALEALTRAALSAKGNKANAAYFLGACLMPHNPLRARAYFHQSLRENPLHLRAWVSFCRSVVHSQVRSALREQG